MRPDPTRPEPHGGQVGATSCFAGLGMRPRDATAERILDAARKLCGTQGFRVEGKDIAAEASLSEASMYRRFPRRIDIVETILEEMLKDLEARLSKIPAQCSDDARSWIREINRIGFDHIGRYGRLASDTIAGHLPPELERHLARIWRLWSFMGSVIEQGVRNGQFRDDINPRLLLATWRTLMSADTVHALQQEGGVGRTDEMPGLVSEFLLSVMGTEARSQ